MSWVSFSLIRGRSWVGQWASDKNKYVHLFWGSTIINAMEYAKARINESVDLFKAKPWESDIYVLFKDLHIKNAA